MGGHHRPPTFKHGGKERLKSRAGSYCDCPGVPSCKAPRASLQHGCCSSGCWATPPGTLMDPLLQRLNPQPPKARCGLSYFHAVATAGRRLPHRSGDSLRCPGDAPVLLSLKRDDAGLQSPGEVREGVLHLFCRSRDPTVCSIMTQTLRLSPIQGVYLHAGIKKKSIHCVCLGSAEWLGVNFSSAAAF